MFPTFFFTQVSTPLCVVTDTRLSCKTSTSAIWSQPAITALGPLEFTSPIGQFLSFEPGPRCFIVYISDCDRPSAADCALKPGSSVYRVSFRQIQEAFYDARTASVRKDARPSIRRIRRADPPIEVRQHHAGGNHVCEFIAWATSRHKSAGAREGIHHSSSSRSTEFAQLGIMGRRSIHAYSSLETRQHRDIRPGVTPASASGY